MIASLAAPLFVISGLPQIIKMYRRKSSDDISEWTYIVTWVAILMVLFEAEGGVFVANLFSFIMVSINLSLIVYYRYGQ